MATKSSLPFDSRHILERQIKGKNGRLTLVTRSTKTYHKPILPFHTPTSIPKSNCPTPILQPTSNPNHPFSQITKKRPEENERTTLPPYPSSTHRPSQRAVTSPASPLPPTIQCHTKFRKHPCVLAEAGTHRLAEADNTSSLLPSSRIAHLVSAERWLSFSAGDGLAGVCSVRCGGGFWISRWAGDKDFGPQWLSGWIGGMEEGEWW